VSEPVAIEGPGGRFGRSWLPRASERQTLVVGVLLALAVVGPLFLTSERWARVLLLVVVYAVLASGLNLLVGFTGLLDLGYIAFFTIGAYFTALLTVRVAVNGFGLAPEDVWWLFFVNLLAGGLVAGCFGVLLGYPTLRARGDYLAIMTLAFGEVVRLVALNWTGLTNGPIGIRGVPPVRVASFEFIDPLFLYYMALAVGGLVVFAISRIVRSHVGRAWVAIRDDALVAECMGINTHRYKLLAYASGAFVAGLIGVFFAHMQQFINPDSFALEDNMLVLCLVILGGAGTVWGPVVGAALWILFQEWASDLGVVQAHPELRMMALALLILLVVRFVPRGIVARRPRLSFPGLRDSGPEADEPEPLPSPVVASRSVLVRAERVACRFGGVAALAGVDLEVRPGEILGVIGPNGAGKSTLFNVLSGVQACTTGRVLVGDDALDGVRASDVTAKGIARTFQNIRLFADMSVLENLLVGAHAGLRANQLAVVLRTRRVRAGEQRARARAEAILEVTGLAAHRDTPATTLSYGHQRRVEIARALMTGPRVLLLDEPAAGLNETETAELGELIRRVRDSGVAIVLVEHDMTLLMTVSDRVIVLDHGEKIADASPTEVRNDQRVLAAYLGSEV
jgi:branched-chain amino acid transport system permease protein